jgi:hypothetical protein
VTAALLTERTPRSLFEERPAPRRTCDDALSDLWDDLGRERPGTCPLCGGRMEPRLSAGAGVVGGRCRSCGTDLA